MYESHASYGRCGLGSKGTDRLVALVRGEGPAAGLYGARITGGGSGGTVAVIGRRGGGARDRARGGCVRTADRIPAAHLCGIVAGCHGVRRSIDHVVRRR